MIQLQIQGMRCSGCADKITQAVLKRDASASRAICPPLHCETSFRRSAIA
jgi:copper chaperone CopZ